MWAFPAHDHPRPGRISDEGTRGQNTGDLGQPGTVTVTAISVDRVDPHLLRDRGDRRPFPLGDCPADREPAAHRLLVAKTPDVDEELLRAARTIRADQDRGAVPVGVRELGQRGVQDGDVVSGGIATRVALPQLGGEELAGVVAERQQRVIAKRLLERRRVGAACSFSL